MKCSITLWREANGGLCSSSVDFIDVIPTQELSRAVYKLFASFFHNSYIAFEYYSKTKSKHKNILIVVAPKMSIGAFLFFGFFTGVNDFP